MGSPDAHSAGGLGGVVIDIPQPSSSPAQQEQQQLLVPQGNAYEHATSRALAVESVQSTIVELGEIMQQLAVMVAEHGQSLHRIDQDVDDSLAMTTAGYSELQRYANKMRSNRGLIFRVFAVLFFFIVLFGTFFT